MVEIHDRGGCPWHCSSRLIAQSFTLANIQVNLFLWSTLVQSLPDYSRQPLQFCFSYFGFLSIELHLHKSKIVQKQIINSNQLVRMAKMANINADECLFCVQGYETSYRLRVNFPTLHCITAKKWLPHVAETLMI